MKLSLSPRLEELFAAQIAGRELKDLANEVVRLSDFYLAQHGARTPWSEPHVWRAYCAYFLPLNVVRMRAALREVKRFLPLEQISEIWDFGSGIGATHWALEQEDWMAPRGLICQEIDREAIRLHGSLSEKFGGRWRPEWNAQRAVRPGALGVFSFSFLEMQNNLPKLADFSHLLFVEPSFRDVGRMLMEWRQRLMDTAKYTPLAPCTHSQACPLLAQSSRDWCHMRVFYESSKQWQKLEALLPMKNRTLTYSYLLMSRDVKDVKFRGTTRVIGDTLQEKGKARQMICRGPSREFLAWLKRDGEPPFIPHGALITDLGHCETKSNELRPFGTPKWEES